MEVARMLGRMLDERERLGLIRWPDDVPPAADLTEQADVVPQKKRDAVKPKGVESAKTPRKKKEK